MAVGDGTGEGTALALAFGKGSGGKASCGSSLRLSTVSKDGGVSMRGGAGWPLRSMDRSISGGLTRRMRIGALAVPLRPSCTAAPGESSTSRSLTIGPRRSTLSRTVLPLSSAVTSA